MDGPFLLRPKLVTKGGEFQGVYGCSTKKPNSLSVETLMPKATGYYTMAVEHYAGVSFSVRSFRICNSL